MTDLYDRKAAKRLALAAQQWHLALEALAWVAWAFDPATDHSGGFNWNYATMTGERVLERLPEVERELRAALQVSPPT